MLPVLYHFYRWTTAAKFLFGRRILPAGWGIGMASIVAATMLMGSPITPLYQMFALLLGLSTVALFWAWSRRAKLRALRELPTHAAVGQTVRYTVLVSNDGPTLRLWSLQETPVDPRPSQSVFLLSREPGEAWRRLKTYHSITDESFRSLFCVQSLAMAFGQSADVRRG